MKGKIDHWKEDKGFGFIKPDNGSEKVFFHISSVKTNARRPQVGDTVLFDSIRDSKKRLKAKSVVIEGVATTKKTNSKQKFISVKPPQKNVFDYFLILICICSLLVAGVEFFRTGVFDKTLIYLAPALMGFFLLNRSKTPNEKSFSCSGCKKITDYDQRTIQAWNRGFTRLYCKSCHHDWLMKNPHQNQPSHGKRGGCLGVFALMLIIPTVGSLCFYRWLL